MNEPADTPRDPNYILSQEEFHRGLDRAVRALRGSIGALVIGLAIYLLIAGFRLIAWDADAH